MIRFWRLAFSVVLITLAYGGLCNELNITLASPYASTGYTLNLLESVAAHNDSLYIPALLSILGLDAEGEDDDSGGLSRLDLVIREHMYEALSIPKDIQSLIDFDAVYKIHSPRIIAQYNHFATTAEDDTRRRLNAECKVDRFGNKIPRNADDEHTIWVSQNKKLYCSNADLFAIETQAKDINEALLLFDRVIGEDDKAPLLQLYADINSPDFTGIFTLLYREALAGKLRYIWRYVPFSKLSVELLAGFGATADIKAFDEGSGSTRDIVKEFWVVRDSDSRIPAAMSETSGLGIKLAAFIMYHTPQNTSQNDFLETVVNNLPKFAPHILDTISDEQMTRVTNHIKLNQKIGLGKESNGLYVNGSPMHKGELDVLKLVQKVTAELKLISELGTLGLNAQQAKHMVKKFALLSAVKQSQFRMGNTLRGNNENRFRLFEHAFDHELTHPRGIVYFNDLESDPNYQQFSSDRERVYLGPESKVLHPNQIPPLKENIHDVVFAIDVGDRDQLRVLFALAKIILDNGLPQQVGLVPLKSDNDLTLALIERFYFIARNSKSEALAFLYKFMEAKDEQEIDALLFSIKLPANYNFQIRIPYDTLEDFSLTMPTIAFNGVLHDLSIPDWQVAMGSQIRQDVSILKHFLKTEDLSSTPLREMLYRNAESTRNTIIIPLDPGNTIYKSVDLEMIQSSMLFRSESEKTGTPFQIWIVGDFNREKVLSQLQSALFVVVSSTKNVQLRILHTGNPSRALEVIQASVDCQKLGISDVQNISSLIEKNFLKDYNTLSTNPVKKLLENKDLPIHDAFLLLNSRYIKLDKILTTSELELLIKYEHAQRLALLQEVVENYTQVFEASDVLDLAVKGISQTDWFDLISGTVTKSFYVDDTYFVSDVARFDFSQLDFTNAIDLSQNEEDIVEILLIVDPVDPYTQELVSIVQAVKDFSFVTVRILLQPELSTDIIPNRFFCHTYVSPLSVFNAKGRADSNHGTQFANLPQAIHLQVQMLTAHNWVAKINDTSKDFDVSHVSFKYEENNRMYASFVLQNILLEGTARNIRGSEGVSGLQLTMKQDNTVHDTAVLSTFGYFQFPARPGTWSIGIKDTESKFSLLSIGHKFMANIIPQPDVQIEVFDLMPRKYFARFAPNLEANLPKKSQQDQEETLHIFSVASGLQYERFVRVMMASVRKHTDQRVKFWLLDTFLSAEFKRTISQVSEELKFEFELIHYKWPYFLRAQTEHHRVVWGYKILFLDVLLPQSLHRVIYVDADQVARADLKELYNVDLKGAPYGFVPMCESRPETRGFQFWKQKGGFWQKLLQEDLKYHISALYVVDLDRFREMGAGDILRAQYQKISADGNSLANLDQDLPNSLQRTLTIHSLDQSWLWCETWCDEESKTNAKMIDMCTNPLTKEAKIDAANRIVPEWTEYEAVINETMIRVEANYNEVDPRFRSPYFLEQNEDETRYESDSDWDHDEL